MSHVTFFSHIILMVRLIYRDLSNNELTAIYRETFEYLTKLKRLKLDNNQIVQIANGAFNNTPNLQIL